MKSEHTTRNKKKKDIQLTENTVVIKQLALNLIITS